MKRSRLRLAIGLVWLMAGIVGCADDDDNPPSALPEHSAAISGQVTIPLNQEGASVPVADAQVHVFYENINGLSSPDTATFDVVEPSWVTVKIVDLRGEEEATLVDGLIGTGRHLLAINPDATYNGVHQLRFEIWTPDRDSLRNSAEYWWLKNAADPEILMQSVPIAETSASGRFSFVTAADLEVTLQDFDGTPTTVVLNRVTVLAVHPNHGVVSRTIDVHAGERLTVNLSFPIDFAGRPQ